MRCSTALVIIIALLFVGVSVTGCGAQQARPPLALTGAPAFPELPPPSSLHPHAASTVNHVLQGSEYRLDMIPPQRVALSGTDDASFSPQWTNNHASTFDKLAFALYAFDFDDAGITGRVTLKWATAPPRHACWIGLPYYPEDRWQWQEYVAGSVTVPDLPLYIGTTPEMTNMFPVVVLLTGKAPAVLDKLALFEYYPANFGLLNGPSEGTGEIDDPLQADNKLTLFLSVFNTETMTEMAGDPQSVFTITPDTAGEIQQLATSAAFHTAPGYTGAFSISARYAGNPTEPQSLYFTAIDTGPAANQLPVPDLAASPTYGKPPLTVAFDARDSYDPDGLVQIYRWDFDGDGAFDDASNARTISHEYATDGIYDAKLEIEDADGAVASATARITVSSSPTQWHLSIVQQAIPDGISYVGQFCSICEVDGVPAIAYSDQIELETAGRVNYIRAQDALGAAWNSPVELRRVDSASATTGTYVQLSQVDGRPAVAFAEQSGGILPYYLRADDVQGTAWSGVAKLVDTTAGVSCGQHVQLIDVVGVPGLTYFEDTNGQLIWIKGADADGTGFTGRTVLDTKQGHDDMGNVGEFSSLALIGGRPAVSYLARYIQAETGNQVRYLRAQDAAGDAWGTPAVIDQASSIAQGTAMLELASGVPGVFYQDYSLTQSMYSFVSGTDADGTGWSAKASAASSPDSNWFEAVSPVLWNAKPFVGCILQEGFMDPVCTAMCTQALQEDGSAWESLQAIAVCGDSYSLDMHVVGGLPVICYYNSVQDALYFGIYY